MSQATFAREIGMNASVYNRYERGLHDIPLSVAKRICMQFDESLDYLACMNNEVDYETIAEHEDVVTEREIDELIENMSDEEFKYILKKYLDR